MSTVFDTQTLPMILCCMCGTAIPSNPSNMCVNCVRSQVDISEGIPKQLNVQYDRSCGRYLNPPNHWTECQLESRELLTICLKRVKGLNKVKLVDASFIWTEPHSKRLKVKLTIQKEAFTNTILQQVFVIEFVIQNMMCDQCHKTEAKDTWSSVVQVRQKVDHKRTFLHLEQLILKHGAQANCLHLKERPDGLDFYYSHKNHSRKFVDFLQAVVPIRYKLSDKLVSHDEKSGTANQKTTFSVEIVPVCKEDLIFLPHKLAQQAGGISPLMLCLKVGTQLSLIDPLTLRGLDVPTQTYWTHPFVAPFSAKSAILYQILDITPAGPVSGKYALADVQCVRESDYSTTFFTRTHLGRFLKPGDWAYGYDLSTANFNDSEVNMKGRQMPDVILIKKGYPETRRKNRQRHWRLGQLTNKEEEETDKKKADQAMRDRELFLRDLEEDKDLRAQYNLFKTEESTDVFQKNKEDREGDMAENEEEFPDVELEELMDELSLAPVYDDEDGDNQ